MYKKKLYLLTSLLVGIGLIASALFAVGYVSAQSGDEPKVEHKRAPNVENQEDPVASGETLQAWTLLAPAPFQYTRFDGVFVPGPDGEPWANKIYFLGGRTGGSTEDASIWMYDPVAGTFSDTLIDIDTSVSNYTANLISNDGTGNGPGIYLIGGYDASGVPAGNIGTIQRFYPQTGLVESLPDVDDWDVLVAGNLVGAMGNAVVDDVIYVFGGWENITSPYFYAGTWAFDPTLPSGSRWTDLGVTINPARSYIQVAVQGGKIYAMGGISTYVGGDLAPTDVVEVFDTANPGLGWLPKASLPVAIGEGRGFGFDADTLSGNQPGSGYLYTAGGGDWPDPLAEAMEYSIAGDTWDQTFPDMNQIRRDHAGVYVPICTDDPTDGLPGMWVFGGRMSSDSPPYADPEFYPLECPAESRVLLVEDDWDFDVPDGGGLLYYTNALDLLGYAYDVWNTVNQGNPTAADMSGYTAVIWFTGYAWNDVFNPTNEAEVGAYLDGGGKLFLSSQEYHYDAGLTAFMTGYLGVDSVTDDTIELDPAGVPGGIADGLGPYAMVRPDDYAIYWPTGDNQGPYDDEVYASTGAHEPFLYDASQQTNSTNFNGGVFKTVFLAWPLEWIDTDSERAEILGPLLDWLLAPPTEPILFYAATDEVIGFAGTTVSDTFTLVNLSGMEDTYDLSFTSDVTWTVGLPGTIGPIPNGALDSVDMTVDIPADATCNEVGTFTVTATSQTDPGITASATITVRVTCGVYGTIIDANTGLPIQNAYVWIQTDPDGITGEYYDGYTDAEGNYQLDDIVAGFYYFGADALHYQPSFYPDGWPEGAITFTMGAENVIIDVALVGSHIVWDPDAFTVDVAAGGTTNRTMTLSNIGSGPYYYNISVLDGSQPQPPDGGALAIPELPRVDQQIFSDIAASPDRATDFVAVLGSQADLSAAYGITDWSERGQAVYDMLTKHADATQAGLRSYLTSQQVDFTPLYIINAVIIHSGDTNLVNNLAARQDISQLIANRKIAIEDQPGNSWDQLLQMVTVPTVVEWNILQINADDVWTDYSDTGEGIVVAEIDSGTQWDHPALINQYRGWDGVTADHNYNWYDPYFQCPDNVPCAGSAHGTHVMGTMVGDDGGANQIGVAPGAKWISCKGGDSVSGYLLTNELLTCAQWIIAPWDLNGENPNPDKRPNVVNNSWGGGPNDYWYGGAIDAWRAAGIFPAFANGNAGPSCSSAHSPGDNWQSFGVGASDNTNHIASFSGRGPALYTGILKPQITAPGVSIRSSIPGNSYSIFNGTSMATPHVSGAVALLWSAAPELIGQIDLTAWVLEQSALPLYTNDGCGGDLPDSLPNNTFGYGLLDIDAAVTMAKGETFTPDWVTVDPQSGTVESGEVASVDLTFTAPEAFGVYTATLWMVGDDPYNPDVRIPLTMNVVPGYDVTFTYHDLEDVVHMGENVTVVGDFNGWTTPGYTLVPNADYSLFSATIKLPAGTSGYKYYVPELPYGQDSDMLNTSERTIDISSAMTVDDYRNVSVGLAHLGDPIDVTIAIGEDSGPLNGEVFIQNVTSAAGEGRGVKAQLGYGTSVDPATWEWLDMTYTADDGSNDLFSAVITPEAPGVYNFGVRFDGNWAEGNPNKGWTDGDRTGILTVQEWKLYLPVVFLR